MIAFFRKPLREINAADIDQLVADHYPEGFELEYKATLPEKNGQPAAWLSGKDDISPNARDKILAEVIAFANAQGGYLLLGISETREKPPRAEKIMPLPRIGELARRLEDQVRTCIEPPIPRFEVHPIETTLGTGMGVLVIYCAASNGAPHRNNINNEANVRRGTSSVRMTMLEIQEMAVNVARGLDRLPKLFADRRAAFHKWIGTDRCAAFRVTGIPLRKFPDPGRLFGRLKDDILYKRYRAHFGTQVKDIRVALHATDARPVLRGIRNSATTDNGGLIVQQFQDGTVDLWFLNRPPDQLYLYHNWVLGGVAVTLELIDQLRSLAAVPVAEYALELEIDFFNMGDPITTLTPRSLQYRGPLADVYGSDIRNTDELPIIMSDIPVESRSEFDSIITRIDMEIYDALGLRTAPRKVTVEWDGL